jgi:copper transport protein
VRRWLSLLSLLLLLLIPSPVWAHALLVQSAPAKGSVATTSLIEIRLQFSEPVLALPGAIQVYDQDGKRWDRGEARTASGEPTVLLAEVKPLPDGLYTVVYRVTSEDGHLVQGSYGFTAGKGAPGASFYEPVEQEPGSGFAVVRGLSHAVTLYALLLSTGVALVWGLVIRSERWRPLARLWSWSLAAGLVGTLVGLGARALEATGLGLADSLQPAVLGGLLRTPTGMAMGARLLLLLLAPLTLPLIRRSWGWAAFVGGLLLLTVAASGHAVALAPVWFAVALDWLHLLSASVWFGGLALLALYLGPNWPQRRLGEIVRRFSALVTGAIGLMIVSGLYPALKQVNSLEALTETAYGQALMAKVALAVVALLLGGYNLVKVGPGLRAGQTDGCSLARTTRIELGLLVLIVGLATGLTQLPPARVALPPETLNLGLHTRSWEIIATMDPLLPGDRVMNLKLASHEGGLPAGTELTLELSNEAEGAAPVKLRAQQVGEGRYQIDHVPLTAPGEWKLRFYVEAPGQERESVGYTITVRRAP